MFIYAIPQWKFQEKILFWPFLGKKYIACGDKMVFLLGFWSIYSKLLMLYGQVLLYEHYSSFIKKKRKKNDFKILKSNFFTHFKTFFSEKIAIFVFKSGFWPFIW